MKVDDKNLRPIWLDKDLKVVKVIDQRRLPHKYVIADLKSIDDIIMASGSEGPVRNAALLVKANSAPPIFRPTHIASSPINPTLFFSLFSSFPETM